VCRLKKEIRPRFTTKNDHAYESKNETNIYITSELYATAI